MNQSSMTVVAARVILFIIIVISTVSARSMLHDHCPVHPDTPVILNGKETYFTFDQNEPRPAYYPGEDEDLTCPANPGSNWQWPGPYDNLKATCPWNWVTKDTWDIGMEIYPRYIKEAQCLCSNCMHASGLGCHQLRRPFKFYLKFGCQGNKPVFYEGPIDVTVGCYCADKSVIVE